ncbi:MAG: hypothetical protein PHP45_10635 [Elusimicrobiales bacterium]|nr:hypothetical protein [Elusimicrobiales bacterium]
MLKELSKKDLLALLNIPEARIPEILILRGTRNLKTAYKRHKKYFTGICDIGSPNAIFEDVFIGKYRGATIAYASVYGDAMASEITHVFGKMGTKLALQTGTCGGLARNLLPGSLICVSSAYCGEGAARCYLPRKKTIRASLELTKGLNISAHIGKVYTTSALFAEGNAEIQKWHDAGYCAVDMETASTFAVAEYFGMKKLSFLKVFDNPFTGKHLMQENTEADHLRRQGELNLTDTLFAVIDAYINAPIK